MSKNLTAKPTLTKNTKFPKRGEVWLIKCDKIKEFSKNYRPALIISSDEQNEFDNYVVVAMMTSTNVENVEPFEVFIGNTLETGLDEPSKIVLNHPFSIFKELRLEKKLGEINRKTMEKVKKAWKIAFDVEDWYSELLYNSQKSLLKSSFGDFLGKVRSNLNASKPSPKTNSQKNYLALFWLYNSITGPRLIFFSISSGVGSRK